MKYALGAIACIGWLSLGAQARAQPRKVAALCVAVDRRLDQDAAAAGVALQRALENDARVDAVNLTAMALGDGRIRRAKDGAALLSEALGYLDEMNDKAALRKSTEAVAAFAESDLTVFFGGLLDSMAARAFALFMASEKEQLSAELVKLLTLKRDYVFDPQRATPAFLAVAAEARAVAGRGLGSMEVRTSPAAAEVFVDGVYRGIAPASVAGLAQGIHFVTLRALGYEVAQQRAPAGSAAPMSVVLKPAANERGLLELIRAVKSGTPPGSGGAATALAEWARADEVLVVALQRKGDGTSAVVARYASGGRVVASAEEPIKKPEAVEELARKVLFQAAEEPRVPPPRPAAQLPPPPETNPPPVVQAEVRDSNNALFVELLGSGVLYSVNYERFIGDFSVRLGASYLPFTGQSSGGSGNTIVIPLTAGYLGLHLGSHCLDLGLGPILVITSGEISGTTTATTLSGSSTGANIGGTAIIGYRYAPLHGGFMFRVAFTPIFGVGGFQAWGGVALGAVF